MPPEKTVSHRDDGLDRASRSTGARGYLLAPLGDAVDTVALMTYDQHGPGWSGPARSVPCRWQREALATLLEKVPRREGRPRDRRLRLHLAAHGTGHSLTVKQVRKRVAADGATPRWRAGAGRVDRRLSDGTVLWWSDGDSYELRVQLAKDLRRARPGALAPRLRRPAALTCRLRASRRNAGLAAPPRRARPPGAASRAGPPRSARSGSRRRSRRARPRRAARLRASLSPRRTDAWHASTCSTANLASTTTWRRSAG